MNNYYDRLKKQWKKEKKEESESKIAKLIGLLGREGRITDIEKASEARLQKGSAPRVSS